MLNETMTSTLTATTATKISAQDEGTLNQGDLYPGEVADAISYQRGHAAGALEAKSGQREGEDARKREASEGALRARWTLVRLLSLARFHGCHLPDDIVAAVGVISGSEPADFELWSEVRVFLGIE